MVMLHSYVSLPEGICVCGINDWNKTIGIRLGRIIGIITRGNDSDNNWKQNVWISAFFPSRRLFAMASLTWNIWEYDLISIFSGVNPFFSQIKTPN